MARGFDCTLFRIYIFVMLVLFLACVIFTGCTDTSDKSDNNSIKAEERSTEKKTEEERSTENILTFSNIKETEDEQKDDSYNFREKRIQEKIADMTLEEKVAQMFIIFPESLVEGVDYVTTASEQSKEAINKIPVGGIVYMSENLKNPGQVKEMLSNIQNYSLERINLPLFLCVDEEGGRIARIANNKMFGVDNVGSMSEIGEKNDPDIAYIAGVTVGSYLSELGFNLDFAPVADVQRVTVGSVLYRRTFSDDPQIVSSMTGAFSKGLESKGIISVYKHFPGHGSTVGDPHKGYAYTDKTIEELYGYDLVPFKKAIEDNVSMIMVGHISIPNINEDGVPASLSKTVITDLLRDDMGYDGVVVTDAMNMGAIKDNYESGEAAVMAVKAGADIVLMPKDFKSAYQAILTEVKNGDVTEERINYSVVRILRLKMNLMDKKGQKF